MQRPITALAVAALVLAGCAKSAPGADSASAEMAAAPAAPAPARDSAAAAPGTAPTGPAVSVPMLAYDYRMGLEVPMRRMSDLIGKHEKACADAGPQTCQVIGSQIEAQGTDGARATLTIRARPDWLKSFRAQVRQDAQGSGGKVAASSVEAEDLTRQIVDTEAGLRAKTALRGRLEQLLASRPGSLSDLLEVERELARVQGEIDATQSELAVMRTRIATSKLTISYTAQGSLAPDSALRPLSNATHDIAKTVAVGFAAIIYVLAALFPFAVVFGPLIWLFVRWRRKRKAARLAAAEGAPPA
jgi:hypothetical protein